MFIIIAILTDASGHRLLVTMEAGHELTVTVAVRYKVWVIVRASDLSKMLVPVEVVVIVRDVCMLVPAEVVNRDQMIQKLQLV